jgi:hypothetical protein
MGGVAAALLLLTEGINTTLLHHVQHQLQSSMILPCYITRDAEQQT